MGGAPEGEGLASGPSLPTADTLCELVSSGIQSLVQEIKDRFTSSLVSVGSAVRTSLRPPSGQVAKSRSPTGASAGRPLCVLAAPPACSAPEPEGSHQLPKEGTPPPAVELRCAHPPLLSQELVSYAERVLQSLEAARLPCSAQEPPAAAPEDQHLQIPVPHLAPSVLPRGAAR